MLLSFILSVFAISGILAETSLPKLTGKIIGGTVAYIKDAEYQVSLLGDSSHVCGGSIINQRTIVTAAHCVDGGDPKSYTVRAGSLIPEQGGQVVQVAEIHVHESYRLNHQSNDIAVLILKSDLVYGMGVAPIKMCEKTATEKQQALVTGWGIQFEGAQRLAQQLQKVRLNIVSVENCNLVYGDGVITDQMICASAPGKNACPGDSGGPMVVDNCLSGVVSWGVGCGRPNFPGVFTNVGVLYSWVNKYVYKN